MVQIRPPKSSRAKNKKLPRTGNFQRNRKLIEISWTNSTLSHRLQLINMQQKIVQLQLGLGLIMGHQS